MGPCFSLVEHLFCLSHCKTYWTMSVDNVSLKICLLGTSNSMIPLTFFPRCKPKWSGDKFNNQSHALQVLGRLHGPCVNNPLTSLMTHWHEVQAKQTICAGADYYNFVGRFTYPKVDTGTLLIAFYDCISHSISPIRPCSIASRYFHVKYKFIISKN